MNNTAGVVTGLRFRCPSGGTFSLNSAEEVHDKVRFGGDAFWKTGSFMGDLTDDHRNQLALLVESPDAVVVRYCPAGGDAEYVLRSGSAPSEVLVLFYPGGMRWHVPRDYLVDHEVAARAVDEFIRMGGTRPAVGCWIEIGGEHDRSVLDC